MTNIQVNYQSLMEQRRHNLEMEALQQKEHKAKYSDWIQVEAPTGTLLFKGGTEGAKAISSVIAADVQKDLADATKFEKIAKGSGEILKFAGNAAAAIAALFI